MHNVETIVLEPGNLYQISNKTDIPWEELSYRCDGAEAADEVVVFLIETRVSSTRRKKSDAHDSSEGI